MWLIDTTTFALRLVHAPSTEYPYAILSHTWDGNNDDPLHQEVVFQDMRDLQYSRSKTGWKKIEETCALARGMGLKWAWVDTCCIDRSSSAELSEAINSMFRWYQQAAVCFVYLRDLPSKLVGEDGGFVDIGIFERSLRSCRWFTRGWTLQELIAPKEVYFYDQTWQRCGTKHSLNTILHEITGIDDAVLNGNSALVNIPVGRRMSWAAKRKTTRLEDVAYCLLGIFDVNMSLRYGEGMKAFQRLQDMIVQQPSDYSLFAWRIHPDSFDDERTQQRYHGIYASSPCDFIQCGDIVLSNDPASIERSTFVSVNHQLQFQTSMMKWFGDYLMPLYCGFSAGSRGSPDPGMLAIRLAKTINGFVRHKANRYVNIGSIIDYHLMPVETVRISKQLTMLASQNLDRRFHNSFRFTIQDQDHICHGITCSVGDHYPGQPRIDDDPGSWDRFNRTFLTNSLRQFSGMVGLRIRAPTKHTRSFSQDVRILCGFDNNRPSEDPVVLKPWVCILCEHGKTIQAVNGALTAYKIHEYLQICEFSYEQVIASISQQASGIRRRGWPLCTQAQLLSISNSDDVMRHYSLSVDLKTIKEDDCHIHNVRICISPLLSKESDGELSMPN